MDGKIAILTGATGFIGSHLAIELLRQNFERVIVLARRRVKNGITISPFERISRVFNLLEGSNDWVKRVSVIEADITKRLCGVKENELSFLKSIGPKAEFFHVAADTRFREEHRDEIFKTNIDGTRNVLEFVKEIGARRFHHFGTAYCFGSYRGVAFEQDQFYGQQFRNPYEEAKFKAEEVIWQLSRDLRLLTTVYRPSIVVGDSRTGRTCNFEGYYHYFRAFEVLKREVISKLKTNPKEYIEEGIYLQDGILHLPITIWGAPDATVNIVCIDYVINLVTLIASSDKSAGRTFHVVNPRPPKYGYLTENSLKQLGILESKSWIQTSLRPQNASNRFSARRQSSTDSKS